MCVLVFFRIFTHLSEGTSSSRSSAWFCRWRFHRFGGAELGQGLERQGVLAAGDFAIALGLLHQGARFLLVPETNTRRILINHPLVFKISR